MKQNFCPQIDCSRPKKKKQSKQNVKKSEGLFTLIWKNLSVFWHSKWSVFFWGVFTKKHLKVFFRENTKKTLTILSVKKHWWFFHMSAQHPEKTPKHQQCFSWKNTYEMMFFYQRNMISSFHSSIEMSSRGQKFWRNTKWTQMKILLTLLQFHTEMILSGLSLANIKSSQWHSYI